MVGGGAGAVEGVVDGGLFGGGLFGGGLVGAERFGAEVGRVVVDVDAGCDVEGTVDIGDSDLLDGPLVVVVGSEGKGLSRLIRESCDMIVRIPMQGAAESLNAGVAAGIALYEVARQRRR